MGSKGEPGKGKTPIQKAEKRIKIYEQIEYELKKAQGIPPEEQLFLIAKKRVVIDEGGDEKKLKDKKEIKEAIEALEVDINTKTKKKGNTPLHMAVNHGRGKVVKVLLEMGADVNIKNKGKKTPLDKVTQHLKKYEEMNTQFTINGPEGIDIYDDDDEE